MFTIEKYRPRLAKYIGLVFLQHVFTTRLEIYSFMYYELQRNIRFIGCARLKLLTAIYVNRIIFTGMHSKWHIHGP